MNKTIHQLIQLIGVGAATAAATYAYGRYLEPNDLRVENVDLPIRNLPAHLDGMTIAQLTDFHLLPHTKLPVLYRAIEITKSLNPDLLVLTGDFVCRDLTAIFPLAEAVAGIKAPLGTWAVYGNHDVDPDFPETNAVIDYGLGYFDIPVLKNEHVVLENGLVVAGVEELYNGAPDLNRALEGVGDDDTVLLLCHQPDFADRAAQDPRIIAQISGHTHGGQVRIPGFRPLYLPYYGRKYTIGLYRVGKMWLYVSRGLGLAYYGPVRINCPPEITLFRLFHA